MLTVVDASLRVVSGSARASRPVPLPASVREAADTLPEDQRELSGALMRVNHVGEVCAQALYQAQALTARSDTL
ncbi:MAG: demethoxyubiquinone hydroxylase family protein, partial [Burkholderiaceae bacterium]|nr:demethoxyubiquinone hydroxylase family protein [Burkholderiaceae bacterium]